MTTLAYSHTLVAGTPENINDVQDMFNDVKTLVNGNLDTSNMAATMKAATLLGPYRTVSEAAMSFGSGTSATTYSAFASGTTFAFGNTATDPPTVCPINLPDYAVSGLTTQFRIQALTLTNTVAPAVNFTFGIAQIATTAGASGSIGIGSVGAVQGGVTLTAPANGTANTTTGSDFTLSPSGAYVLVVTLSGTPAVNSRTACTVRLQVHNI